MISSAPAGHRLLERIKVYNDEVDCRDVILLHLRLVAFVVTAGEDASENLRMECLHTAAENGGVRGHVFHLPAFIAQRLDELLRTARTEELHAFLVQLLEQVLQPVLVEDGNQSGLEQICTSHPKTDYGIDLQRY